MDAVKKNTVYAVMVEPVENQYTPPAADTDYVQSLVDGAEMNPAKELLERNIFSGSIGKNTPRTGQKSISGALPVEMRAAETEGDEPEFDKLILSAMGSKRQSAGASADDADSGSPHTTSRIYLLDTDAGSFGVGDIVTVKKAGAFHTSPVVAVSDALGDVYIDLLIPAAAPFADGDAIAALTTYVTADEGHPSLSISKYIEGTRREYGAGCKVVSMSLENFTTGQLASLNFGFEGLSYGQSVSAQPHDPNFSDQLPPIILSACVYQNGQILHVNELTIALENVLGYKTSTCSPNGRMASRVTERNVSGSINPYKQSDNVDQFNRFDQNQSFSLFASARLPTGVAGEYSGVVAFYLPNCLITEMAEADQDGLLQEELSFVASRGNAGEQEELFVSFS